MTINISENGIDNNSNEKVYMVKGEPGDLNHNDIVDNLNSAKKDKVLSARQGKKLKELVDTNITDISNLNDEIEDEISQRTSIVSNLQNQIYSLASGAPLKASSISEMTDTSKVYVNTTDGYWYYHNGSSWIRGSIYQSTSLGENCVSKFNFNSQVQADIYKTIGSKDLMIRDLEDLSLAPVTDSSSGYYHKLHQSSILQGFIISVTPNQTITVEKKKGARFRVATTSDLPAEGVTYNQYSSNENNDPITIELGGTDNYLFIIYYSSSLDTDLTKQEIKDSMKIYYGEWQDPVTNLDNFKAFLANKGVSNGYLKNESVSEEKTSFLEKKAGIDNLYNRYLEDLQIMPNIDQSTQTYGKLVSSDTLYGFYVAVTPNQTITVEKTKGARFRIATTSEIPAIGVTYNQYIGSDNNTKQVIQLEENDNFLFVNYYSSTLDTEISIDEIRKTIKVYYGEWEDTVYNISNLKNGFSNLSNELLNLISYRQLGSFDKGYLCLVADDGDITLSTNTFDILKNYDVPCTFALMSNSDIMNENTGDIDGLKDMINNHGCSVCQHGSNQFDTYTETELIDFLNSEKQFWSNKNINVKGLCYPYHTNNELIRAICGSMFDICCGGWGSSYITSQYQLNTERSNIFKLSRTSVVSYEYLNQAVDYAIQNHKLMIVFWHDKTIANDSDKQTLLENFISYAKTSGIEFITLDKILTL